MKLESTVGVGTRLEIVIHLRPESGEQQNHDEEKGRSPHDVAERDHRKIGS